MRPAELFWNSAWNWASQTLSQRPGPLFAGLFFALTLVLAIMAFVLFARLRSLNLRQRQLHRAIESQATVMEKLKAYVDERVQAVPSAVVLNHVAENSRMQGLSAAQMREELTSVRMDLLAGEPPTAIHNQMDDR
jgi:hypothetical protein